MDNVEGDRGNNGADSHYTLAGDVVEETTLRSVHHADAGQHGEVLLAGQTYGERSSRSKEPSGLSALGVSQLRFSLATLQPFNIRDKANRD